MKWQAIATTEEQEVTVRERSFIVTYSVSASMYYNPGISSGPPERCYPPEGECKMLDLEIEGVFDEEDREVTDPDIIAACRNALSNEELEEQLWEAYHAS